MTSKTLMLFLAAFTSSAALADTEVVCDKTVHNGYGQTVPSESEAKINDRIREIEELHPNVEITHLSTASSGTTESRNGSFHFGVIVSERCVVIQY